MTPKATSHVIQGMQKDTSKSKVGKEFAFNNHNIRITAREDNTLLTITNEKGTRRYANFSGTYLGHCVLQDQLVLFYKNEDKDYISVYDGMTLTELYIGNLNFSLNNTLETLGVYENERIQKVYWVDGINQPRVINIKASKEVKSKWVDSSFDFVPELELKEDVYVEPVSNSSMLVSLDSSSAISIIISSINSTSNSFISSSSFASALPVKITSFVHVPFSGFWLKLTLMLGAKLSCISSTLSISLA